VMASVEPCKTNSGKLVLAALLINLVTNLATLNAVKALLQSLGRDCG
jgi:hypothetical protein